IMDAGQSIEEYSVLCHRKDHDALRDRLTVGDARAARYALVRELRETSIPILFDAASNDGVVIEDRLPFSPLLARVRGANDDALVAVDHPLFARERLDDYRCLVEENTGHPYLDLDLATARFALRTLLGGDFEAIDLAVVSRPADESHLWFARERSMIEDDLAAKERGGGEEFSERLIGLFLSVMPKKEERSYFNSPTCVRVEHGKVRAIARDRFDILGLRSSERMSFDHFRELLAAQLSGAPERLAAMKYPYTARAIAAGIGAEAREVAEEGDVKVLFVDGVGGWNPATSGLIEACLRAELPPRIDFHRIVGDNAMYAALPNATGGIVLVMDALWSMTGSLFEPELDLGAVVGSITAPVTR
ncbi:MAG TPA: hypothetical protein VNN08_04300, partial [Thermoanaerobaculia bacterium]|nr:hypothetical protein [Thermoanaerobaculia bacterium]